MTIFLPTLLALIAGAAIATLTTWALLTRRLQTMTVRATAAEAALLNERERGAQLAAAQNDERAQTGAERERAVRAESTLAAERASHSQLLATIQAAEQQLSDRFAKLSSEALKASSDQFLALAQERMAQHQLSLRGDMAQVFVPLRTTLDDQGRQIAAIEGQRHESFGRLDETIKLLLSGQQLLSQETGNLVNALGKPQVRGQWGELQLRRVIELAGMVEHCDFDTQVTVQDGDGKGRPDLVVRMPNQRQIIVDSKVPMAAFLRALNATADERPALLRAHAQQVRVHIDDIHKRNYPAKVDGAHDYTIIFIPGEVFYHAALEHDAELLEYAFKKSVILASPNTLVAILKAAALGWSETRLAADAKTIRDEGEKVYKALITAVEHLSKVGAALNTATTTYNAAVGSIETRLLPPARKMNELGLRNAKPLPSPDAIETSIRQFTKPELRSRSE